MRALREKSFVSRLLVTILFGVLATGFAQQKRVFSGLVVNEKNESVAGVSLMVNSISGELKTVTDAEGRFNLLIPRTAFSLKIAGQYVVEQRRERVGISQHRGHVAVEI